jgi:hypothetical protein
VFYYEPTVLEKVVRIEQWQFDLKEKGSDQKMRDQGEKP